MAEPSEAVEALREVLAALRSFKAEFGAYEGVVQAIFSWRGGASQLHEDEFPSDDSRRVFAALQRAEAAVGERDG